MNLFPYQIEGAQFLARTKRALLADEMGLGKTAQAIEACKLAGAKDVMVVCPASLVENWKKEWAQFWPGYAGRLVVVSYDKFSRLKSQKIVADAAVFDEAHYLKSKDAKRTLAAFGAKCSGSTLENIKHVFLLTGTPTPNNPSELWPMLRAVMPGAITNDRGKPMSYWQFVEKYCVTRDNGFGIQIIKGKNLDGLKQRIAPYVLRRKKEEVLKDLPGLRIAELPVAGKLVLTPEMDDLMKEVVAALDKHGVDGLQKVAPHVATLRRAVGMAKVAGVVDWVRNFLESGGKKIVLFAHHREVMDALAAGLPTYARVDGSTKDRGKEIDIFQNYEFPRIFIGQIQAAGTGLTLTAASDLVMVESSWVPAENEQAIMRIHRIGQKNACTARFAVLPGSLDERIQRAVVRKSIDIAKLFG